MKVAKGEVKRSGNCRFIGYCMTVSNLADVRATYTKVKRLHPSALHISCAFRLPGIDHSQLRGYEDDGEHRAGRTIYNVLEEQNSFNKAVYVVRYYGNKHLGEVRFQLIISATRSAMQNHQLNVIEYNKKMPTLTLTATAMMNSMSMGNCGTQGEVEIGTGPGDVVRNQNYIKAASPCPFFTQGNSH